MKQFLVGWAIVILCSNGFIFRQDYHMHQRQLNRLKFVCEEAAAAAAQYQNFDEYKNGKFVFNREEGIKAAEYIIKSNLKLDDNFMPGQNNYWQSKVTYKIEFYDEGNVNFSTQRPLYQHSSGMLTQVITSPTIVVSIEAGKPRYRQGIQVNNAFRIAAHGWKSI